LALLFPYRKRNCWNPHRTRNQARTAAKQFEHFFVMNQLVRFSCFAKLFSNKPHLLLADYKKMISNTPVCIILDSDNLFPFSAMLSQSMPSDLHSGDTRRIKQRIDAAIFRSVRFRRRFQNDVFRELWKSFLSRPHMMPNYETFQKLFPQQVESMIEREYIARATAKPDVLCYLS